VGFSGTPLKRDMPSVRWLEPFFKSRAALPTIASGGGGGGTSKKHLIFNWQLMQEPGSPGAGGIWTTPTIAGSSVNFTMTAVSVVFQAGVAGTNTIKIQRSTNAGVTWVDISGSTVSVSSGRTGSGTTSQSISSGDLIQLYWVAVVDTTNFCSIQFEGDQP